MLEHQPILNTQGCLLGLVLNLRPFSRARVFNSLCLFVLLLLHIGWELPLTVEAFARAVASGYYCCIRLLKAVRFLEIEIVLHITVKRQPPNVGYVISNGNQLG
jgi:hypothetical protein